MFISIITEKKITFENGMRMAKLFPISNIDQLLLMAKNSSAENSNVEKN